MSPSGPGPSPSGNRRRASPPPPPHRRACKTRIPLRRRRTWAWLRLIRPLATLTGAATVVAFTFILQDGAPVWHEVLRLGVVMFALLAAAAAMNDYLDRAHDREAHIWRPLPAGLVSSRAAARLAGVLAVVALAVGATLGWRAFLLSLAGFGSVALYNARLRNTPLSWAPFALAFALAPVWVAEAVDRFDNVLWWSFPVGALAGLSAHLVLKLPDYERDDIDGARGVVHWMTIDFAAPVAWAAMGAYIVVAVASANIENLRAEWIAPPAAFAVGVTLAMLGAGFFGVTERRLIWQRWLFTVAIIGLAVGWLGSIIP